MKKKLIRNLSLLLVSGLLAGCANGANKAEPTPKTTTKTEQTSSEKPAELNVMIWDRGNAASGTTAENNATSKFIQESVLAEANVKVNFVPVPRSGSDDKVNVMMAGGNAPDIVLSYSRDLFGDYATKGGLTDLTPYLDEFGPQLKETLGEDILSVGVIDGKQYAIPAKRNLQKIKHAGYIRKDWVDALGKELPTNKQELMDILYEFKEKDPGNVGDKLVPWAMGGNQNTEKFFLNFIGSYVDLSNEKDRYLYPANTKALHPSAKEGLKVMNQLYSDGLIKKDFAIDTNDDIYIQDITNGYAGFILEDNMRPIDGDWIGTLLTNVPTAEFVAINILEDPNGEVITPADPLHGAYLMVPSVSEKNAAAAVKYLNWLANTENSMKVMFTPDYTTDENGVPIAIPASELEAQGYAGTPPDFTIVTQYWDYNDDKDAVVSEWLSRFPVLSKEYFDNFHDTVTSGIYNDPIAQEILSSETRYLSNISKLIIELAYKSIIVSPADFETTYQAEYEKINQAGLQEILDERSAYYDKNVAK